MCDNWIIGSRFRSLGRSISRSLQGASLLWTIPRLKPWAEFCSPSGHKTKASAQGLWPTALSEQNYGSVLEGRTLDCFWTGGG
ncbi:MAG: hypothetical protein QOE88_2884 [Verrucomicrobiota bacterium]|nr:hypothetical protein [Verrucomicrobiota bacterium]